MARRRWVEPTEGWAELELLYAARSRRRPEALEQALLPYHEAWG